jgi:hypothetical protein
VSAGEVTFVGWRRAHVAETGSVTPLGRLKTSVPISVTVRRLDGGAESAAADVPLELLGPGDVAALAPGALRTVIPHPGSTGFETTHCPYVELVPADLPWRYTPAANEAGGGVRPWLVLVVGGDNEVALLPSGRVRLEGALTADYDLAGSAAWAHLQVDASGTELGRILSLRKLGDSDGQARRWTAALVPAFDAAGAAAWTPGQSVEVPCFHSWSFWTADDALDFKAMAVALHPQRPDGLGVVDVRYRARVAAPLAIRGALTTGAPAPDADAPVAPAVAADVATRRAVSALPVRPPIVGLPTYGDIWVKDPAPPAWQDELNADPRRRAVAGLGTRCAILEQDLLLDSARTRWGAVLPVAQRVRALAFGLASAATLWRRRLPLAPERRLLLYGPSLGGIVTDTDQTVLELVTAAERPFAAAFFSGAAKRAMRPATGRSPRGRDLDLVALVTEANRCFEPGGDPPGLPTADGVGAVLGGGGESLTRRIREGQIEAEGVDRESIGAAVGLIPDGRRDECSPVDVNGLVGALDGAIDPTTPHAPGRVRVLGPLIGLDDPALGPTEPCADLDLPAWRFLRDHAKRWLLPGAEKLEPDAVTGLATNPVFVEAFLVGVNQQTVGELRWRNLPVRSGCTPVRRFWDLVHPDTDDLHDDMIGIAAWSAPSRLGEHAPPGTPAAELVIALRTELFRRYPDTLIYLTPATDFSADPTKPAAADRVLPVFVGEVERNLPFFGFPVPPAAVQTHWVVIEQVPHGFQFGTSPPKPPASEGGAYAKTAFISPVRVFIAGAAVVGTA